jgi:hypothetical protein
LQTTSASGTRPSQRHTTTTNSGLFPPQRAVQSGYPPWALSRTSPRQERVRCSTTTESPRLSEWVDVSSRNINQVFSTLTLQLAYGQRTELGDPEFVEGLEAKQAAWISEESTSKRAKMLSDDHTFPPDYYKSPRYAVVVCCLGSVGSHRSEWRSRRTTGLQISPRPTRTAWSSPSRPRSDSTLGATSWSLATASFSTTAWTTSVSKVDRTGRDTGPQSRTLVGITGMELLRGGKVVLMDHPKSSAGSDRSARRVRTSSRTIRAWSSSQEGVQVEAPSSRPTHKWRGTSS